LSVAPAPPPTSLVGVSGLNAGAAVKAVDQVAGPRRGSTTDLVQVDLAALDCLWRRWAATGGQLGYPDPLVDAQFFFRGEERE
jgi:hypothetical protein